MNKLQVFGVSLVVVAVVFASSYVVSLADVTNTLTIVEWDSRGGR